MTHSHEGIGYHMRCHTIYSFIKQVQETAIDSYSFHHTTKYANKKKIYFNLKLRSPNVSCLFWCEKKSHLTRSTQRLWEGQFFSVNSN